MAIFTRWCVKLFMFHQDLRKLGPRIAVKRIHRPLGPKKSGVPMRIGTIWTFQNGLRCMFYMFFGWKISSART